MAGYITFHSKLHRANHHTLSGFDIPDSGFDPIASKNSPYVNIFYNRITDKERTFVIDTNSLEWWHAFTTTISYSALWMRTKSVWTTVNNLSAEWNLGYNAFLNLQSFSGKWVSVYTTVSSYSASWGSPYLMFTNRVQTYTHSKTFSGQTLGLISVSSYNWNLDKQQVAFIDVDQNIFINNPDYGTVVTGGFYTLVLKNPLNYNIFFDTLYQLNEHTYIRPLTGIIVINFIGIEGRLFGDVTVLSAIPLY